MEGVSRSFLTLFAPSRVRGGRVSASLAVPELSSHRRASCHLVADTDEGGGELRETLQKWVSETVGSPSQPEPPQHVSRSPPIRRLLREGSGGGGGGFCSDRK